MKMNNRVKLVTGNKLFKYEDDKDTPDIIRVISSDISSGVIKYYDSNWKKQISTYEELLDEYKVLKADGMIMLTIVSVGDASDVMVLLKDFKRVGDTLPYAICRQSIHDFFNDHEQFPTVGLSVSQETCPANRI